MSEQKNEWMHSYIQYSKKIATVIIGGVFFTILLLIMLITFMGLDKYKLDALKDVAGRMMTFATFAVSSYHVNSFVEKLAKKGKGDSNELDSYFDGGSSNHRHDLGMADEEVCETVSCEAGSDSVG